MAKRAAKAKGSPTKKSRDKSGSVSIPGHEKAKTAARKRREGAREGKHAPTADKAKHESKDSSPNPVEAIGREISRHHIIRNAIIIALAVFLFLAAASLGIIKINFLIDEEIILTVDPAYESINAESGNTILLNYETEVQNYPLCKAECTYSLTDIGESDVLIENRFEFNNYHEEELGHEITLKDYGYGQAMFQYMISCKNRKGSLCPSNNETFTRRTTTVINYEPNPEQKETEKIFLETYDYAMNTTLYANNFLDSAELLVEELPESMTLQISSEVEKLEKHAEEKEAYLSELKSRWESQDFNTISIQAENSSFAEGFIALKEDSESLYKEISERISGTNSLIEDYNRLLFGTELINRIQDTDLAILNNSGMPESLGESWDTDIAGDLSSIRIALTTLPLLDSITIRSLIEKASTVQTKYSGIEDIFINRTSADNNTDAYLVDLSLAEDFRCITDTLSNNCTSVLSPDKSRILSDISAVTNARLDICGRSAALKDAYLSNNTNTTSEELLIILSLLESYSGQFPDYSEEQTDHAGSIMKQRVDALYTAFEEELLEDYNMTPIENYYPENYDKLTALGLNQKIELISETINDRNSMCYVGSKIVVSEDMIGLLNFTNTSIDVPEYESLKQPLPSCCAYGVCGACSASGTNTPLILLHGHSFSGKSNAYTSTEAFTKFENSLDADGIYIISGILNPQPDFTDSESNFGKALLPVAFKPTYYIDYYNDFPGHIFAESKNNNIDSYAIRLDEIVEYVKESTGSDKVDIVAHSMGGLVTRRYLDIFGTDSVNTFIMIGTPNHGTDSQTTTFCKIFGEAAECEDMAAGSLFISKLNSASKKDTLPEKTYILIGKGCEMPDGTDGDGIVSAKSAEISGIETYYYDGKCTGIDTFHSKLLNPSLFPDVYDKVIELLEQN